MSGAGECFSFCFSFPLDKKNRMMILIAKGFLGYTVWSLMKTKIYRLLLIYFLEKAADLFNI